MVARDRTLETLMGSLNAQQTAGWRIAEREGTAAGRAGQPDVTLHVTLT